MLFKSLLKCNYCNHTFRARKERNQIKYRCNNRLKNGQSACVNDSAISEEDLLYNIKKQLELYNIEFISSNEYLKTIITAIFVGQDGNYEITYNDPLLKPTIVTNNKISYGTIQ